MNYKVHSEFKFTRKVDKDITVGLTVYINYTHKTYDFMQDGQEGVFPGKNNTDIEINKAYFELGLEILDFVRSELFRDNC